MSTAGKIALAVACAAALVVGAGVLYIYTGSYNVAATDEHTGIVKWGLATLKTQSIAAHADELTAEIPTDSSTLMRGYHAFSDMCVPCHGAPGVERGWMGKGMNPQPPELSHAAQEFSESEILWIIRHGIKLAGMPALAPTHGEDEMKALTAFVEQLPDMSEEEYQEWGHRVAADTTASVHAGHEH